MRLRHQQRVAVEADNASRKLKKLQQSLIRYGRHTANCNVNTTDFGGCTCGFGDDLILLAGVAPVDAVARVLGKRP